jgi:hypothetical protein
MLKKSVFIFDDSELVNVPYILAFAYPCYKRPQHEQQFLYGSGKDLKDNILNKISSFVFDNLSGRGFKEVTTKMVQHLYENEYFSEYYMENEPWQAIAVINGEWCDITPTHGEIAKNVDAILKRNLEY